MLTSVVVVTGLPGTGKSTLADALARELDVPAFAADWLMGALTPSGILGGLDRTAYLELHYRVLRTLLMRQLMLGQSAILDCVATDDVLADWADLAAEHDARVHVIMCVCTDQQAHRRRVEGRRRNIPGWHEIDWSHVERTRAEIPTLTTPHLRVDAMEPFDDNLRIVLDHLT